jgi:hypothetical protein
MKNPKTIAEIRRILLLQIGSRVAFFFGQKGLMAGLGLQGSKITEITPDR